MRIHVTGLNHEAAPVHVREKLAFARHRLPEALAALRRLEGVDEAAILSTCNRVEVYVCTDGPPTENLVRDFLGSFHGVWPETFAKYTYSRDDADVVAHLFRVASGLDSMVLGEAQITGQVREAYETASESGTAGRVLHRLFQQALSVAKRVRSHTEIGAGRASVGSVAVELAERIFESLADRTVLVVGAGEMGESVVRALRAAGSETTLVANRTFERAEALAEEWGGAAVRYDELPAHLARADIVISSTDAPHYVIRPDDVAAAVRERRGRSLFLIDIAVPRDIDPAAGDVDGCYLYNVDDLQAVVAETLARREEELGRCETIVAAEQEEFLRWLGRLTVAPTIGELSARLHAIKGAELEALLNRLPDLSDEDRQEIERMADRLVNKILHQPIQALRETSASEHREGFLSAVLHLFGLGRERRDE
jgi:glutamyl-tRNA reductase